MKLGKFLLTLATTAFVMTGMFVMSVSVASANVDQDNQNTGPKSENKNILKVHKHKTKIEVNKAKIRNKIRQRLNTGHVVQKGNTKGGDVETGDITTFVDLKNKANEGDDCGCPDEHKEDGDHNVSVTQTNKNTGPKSENKNIVKLSSHSLHKVINKAKVKNKVGIKANTGGVKQKHNTKAGSIKTGDINVGISIVNNVNN